MEKDGGAPEGKGRDAEASGAEKLQPEDAGDFLC